MHKVIPKEGTKIRPKIGCQRYKRLTTRNSKGDKMFRLVSDKRTYLPL
jgi:hypothetical protein